MIYKGYFRTVTKDVIEVLITTSGSTGETEITLAGESPVVISTSSDSVFSPIKSRSCTVSIVTTTLLQDIYSGTSHGTSMVVNNLTKAKCLFFGFVTPAEYNQPWVGVDILEIEGVDAISTLKDYKYSYYNYGEGLVQISNILKKLLKDTAGYEKIWMHTEACRNSSKSSSIPTVTECINDDIFFSDDDEHEPITSYEVLEEIGNFYGFSMVPDGDEIWIIDYEALLQGKSTWKDLVSGSTVTKTITGTITKGDYLGDDQNMEMEPVYNRVLVEADVRDVEADDLDVDYEKEMNLGTFFRQSETGAVRSDGKNWTINARYFELILGSYGGFGDNNECWRTVAITNTEFYGFGYRLTDNFTNIETNIPSAAMMFPYNSGGLLNVIPCQCALPSQLFGYESTKEMPFDTSWENYISFFPSVFWIHKYYADNNISGSATQSNWENSFYENHLGGTYPVLYYYGDKFVNYSPADSNQTSYLCFTGDIWWQRNCSHDDVNYHMWSVDGTKIQAFNYPISMVGANGEDWAYSRRIGDSGYNTGWRMLKVRLKIGDKYWNGSYWTTSSSTFWIPYHKTNVVTDEEALVWEGWNKPVTNHNYTYKVGKDAFVIPITSSDRLYGKMEIQVWMPKIPWSNQLYSDGGYLKVNYEQCPPVIFMKNFGFTLCTVDKSQKWYTADLEKEQTGSDDDIIYKNTINSQNITDMDDLTLKINTWNSKKPIAKSYLCDKTYYNSGSMSLSGDAYYHTSGFVSPSGYTRRQEENLIEKYRAHYSTPKKIYNVEVRGLRDPWKVYTTTALSGTYVVDEQEFDVKSNVNDLKLIEY